MSHFSQQTRSIQQQEEITRLLNSLTDSEVEAGLKAHFLMLMELEGVGNFFFMCLTSERSTDDIWISEFKEFLAGLRRRSQ